MRSRAARDAGGRSRGNVAASSPHPNPPPSSGGVGHVLSELYHFHFKSERRERLFLASLGFAITFGIVRAITHLIKAGVGPFHNVSNGGLHIHHLVWGILLLLLVGYVWLIQEATGQTKVPSWFSRGTAVAYGVGAALTLDEFALWLNLQDVYWTGTGRESVDAVVIFAAFLSAGIWGYPFLAGLARELKRLRKTQ
jgi:hypothetical protein